MRRPSYAICLVSLIALPVFSKGLGDDFVPDRHSCEEYVQKLEERYAHVKPTRKRYLLECRVANGQTTEDFTNIAYARKLMGDHYKSIDMPQVSRLWYLSAYRYASTVESADQHTYSLGAAAYELGLIEKGNEDFSQAFRYFHEAAEIGHNYAQYETGMALATGRGTTKNYIEAYAWLNVCASYSDGGKSDLARNELQTLESKMTAVAVEQAQELSKQYYTQIHNDK